MGNVEYFSKKFKNFSFLKTNGQKTFLQKKSQHAAQVDGVPSSSLKTLAFLGFFEKHDSKKYPCPLKKSENWNSC